MSAATPARTVEINAGGRHFEVSRSLIDRHPDSMLSQLVASSEPGTIFIDRDGDVFAQVLNYLRYGSIVLPATIPKELFLRDLEFYGTICEDGTVQTTTDTKAEDDNDTIELVAQLRALTEIEITGPGHTPVYARGHLKQNGHLSKLGAKGTFWSEWLKEVTPCGLENIVTLEVWIGGALRGGFSDYFKVVCWARVCSKPLLFVCSRPGDINITIDFGWSEEQLDIYVDIDRFCKARDESLLQLISEDLPMIDGSKKCNFVVSLPTIHNRLLGPIDGEEEVEKGPPKNIWVS